jgi:homoserine kinase type II
VAVLTALREEDALRLAAQYGLSDLRSLTGVAAGSVNSNFELHVGGARYFLRLYEERDAAGAERETAMLDRMARSGVPTPAPLRRADGGYVSSVRGKPAALFPWREGTMRCQASVTADDARRVGAALAAVHIAGAGEPCEPGRFRYDDLLIRLQTIADRNDERFRALVPALRDELHRAHARRQRDRALPRGLTHGDLFRDNVLWDDHGRIAALLDFESACDGTFGYDLMVTLLAWCVGDEIDFALSRAMLDGYESVRPLGVDERAALWAEACFAALRFTVTRITDYAMRESHSGPRVVKDWRRFLMRFERLRLLGERGFLQAVAEHPQVAP